MARLDKEKQLELEPKRMAYAKKMIENKGYEIVSITENQLAFKFKNNLVHFFPYSGWASGKSIVSGRGLTKLLNQI